MNSKNNANETHPLTEQQKTELLQLLDNGSISVKIAAKVTVGISNTPLLPRNYIISRGLLPLGGIVSERNYLYPLIEQNLDKLNDPNFEEFLFNRLKRVVSPPIIRLVVNDYKLGLDIFGLDKSSL